MTEAPTNASSWRRRAATIVLPLIIFSGCFLIGRTSLGADDDEAEVSVRPSESRVTLNAPGKLTVAARIPNLIEPPPANDEAPAPAPADVTAVPVETAPTEVPTTAVAPIPAPAPAPAPPPPAPPPPAPPPDNGGGGSGIPFDDSG
jgi:hypothetical protein